MGVSPDSPGRMIGRLRDDIRQVARQTGSDGPPIRAPHANQGVQMVGVLNSATTSYVDGASVTVAGVKWSKGPHGRPKDQAGVEVPGWRVVDLGDIYPATPLAAMGADTALVSDGALVVAGHLGMRIVTEPTSPDFASVPFVIAYPSADFTIAGVMTSDGTGSVIVPDGTQVAPGIPIWGGVRLGFDVTAVASFSPHVRLTLWVVADIDSFDNGS